MVNQEKKLQYQDKKNNIYLLSGIIGVVVLLIITAYTIYNNYRFLSYLRMIGKPTILGYFFSSSFFIPFIVAIIIILIGYKKIKESKISNITLYFFIFCMIVSVLSKLQVSFIQKNVQLSMAVSIILHSYLFPILLVLAIISFIIGFPKRDKII